MNGQQQTTALGDFERYRKPTRREQCLVAMNQLVPWSRLTELVEPMYPTGEGAGRPLESNSGFEAFVEKKLSRSRVLRLEEQNFGNIRETQEKMLFVVNAIDGDVLRRERYDEQRDRRFTLRLRGRF